MKQNIIQSIIRRGLTFVFLSLLMPLGVGAQEYALWIGDTQVTSENAGDILGSGHEGSMSFDAANNILTVNNVGELAVGIESGLDALTIKVSGENTIYSESGAAISYNGSGGGTLTFVKDADADLSSLTLTSFANNKAIEGFALDNITISDPLRLTSPTSMSDILNVTTVTIANYNEAYNISIAGTTVTDLNKDDVLGDGKVSFTVIEGQVPTYTLTLKGVTLTQPIKVGLANLTIDIRGNNSITTDTTCIQNTAVDAVPSLNFVSNADVVGSLTLTDTEENETYGVISENFFSNNTQYFTISRELALIMLRYGNYTSNPYYFVAGEVHNAQLVPSYGVTVGSMQICAGNAADVFGDGKVSFDKETATLTLNNVSDISTISTSLSTLNIDLVGSNSLYRSSDGSIFESLSGEAVTINIKSTGSIKGALTIETPENFSATIKGDNVTLTPVDPIALLSSNVANNKGTLVYGVSYGITITNAAGSYPITSVNRKNVLNDSEGEESVQFDGIKTLILNNANISGIYISDNHNLTNGLDIYLKGNNVIQNSSNAVYGTQIPLSIATSSENPGSLAYICQACSLATANQAFNGYTVAYKNDLIATLDYTNTEIQEKNAGKAYYDATYINQQTVTIAPGLVPVVNHTGEEANLDGDGSGLGTVLVGHETDTQVITADKKMLLTLGDNDGFFSWIPGDDADLWDGEESAKLVVLSTEQNGVPEDKPTTSEFAAGFKGITMAVPAGSYEVASDYKNTGKGRLVVQVGRGTDALHFYMPPRATHNESSIQFVTQSPVDVFLYNTIKSSEGMSRFRAPGRKMANTTTLKSVKVSARSVAATPPPVLMPKVLTKDDVAAAKSGNHITITDTDVTDYADNAFEDQTGITYIDLSATSITGKKIDRDELPASATVFLPASNDDNSAKNIVIAGVCNDLQLNDAVDFEIPSDFTAVKASLNRDFTSDLGKNCTVCVPFALDNTQAAELGTFYTLSAHSGNTITMESVDATEANKAYMFKPAKETFSAEMVDVKKADPVRTTVSSLSFLGTYQQITGLNSTADFVYYCFMQTGEQAGKFVKITSAVDVNPFRAYMELPASKSLARVLDLNFGEGGATGIESLTPNPSSMGEGNVGFYDLQGRRVLYPKKGLYILNGKKVIIK